MKVPNDRPNNRAPKPPRDAPDADARFRGELLAAIREQTAEIRGLRADIARRAKPSESQGAPPAGAPA